MMTEIIQVTTFLEDGSQRDIIQTECWFTALNFAKEAAQLNLKVVITSWEAEVN
jgi:hypothetical protein